MIKSGWTEVTLKMNPTATTQTHSDRTVHAARRRLLNNAFSESALKGLEKYILVRLREWCDRLGEPKENDDKRSGWSKEKDLSHWANLFTIDVLGDLCFGADFAAMRTGNNIFAQLIMSFTRFQDWVSQHRPIRSLASC
jgi:cytochrome P450